MKPTHILMVIVPVVFFLVMIHMARAPEDVYNATERASANAPVAPPPETGAPNPTDATFGVEPGFTPQFTPIWSKSFTVAGLSQVKAGISVPAGLSRHDLDQDIRAGAAAAYDQSKPDGIVILAYIKGTEQSDMYTAGQLEWQLGEDGHDHTTDVTISDQYFHQADAAPAAAASIPEDTRKKITWSLAEAEDRAQHDADVEYPTNVPVGTLSQEQLDYNSKRSGERDNVLEERYKREVYRRFGITESQGSAIETEAETKNWPTPPVPPNQ